MSDVETSGGDQNDTSPSFAEALRGKPLPVWPKTLSRTVGGKGESRGYCGLLPLAHPPEVCVEGEEEREEGMAVPSFKEAFTEALLTAQVSAQLGQQTTPTPPHPVHCAVYIIIGQSSKKTAKKGRKKLVLFSTGGARGTHN